MSGILQILLGGSQALPVDPYFYSVTSLLHGDGTNGGQNNTFLDSSTNNFTITRNGNTTQGAFSPFSQTGWGNYFNGPNTGSYLRTPVSTDFQLGTSDFTIEFWAYTTDITSDTTVCQTDSGGSGFFGMLLNYSNGTNITWYATSNGSSWNVINGGVLCSAASIRNTWTHFAYVRNGSTFTAYVNGIAVYTTTSSASIYQSANQFVFGSSFAGSHPSNFGGHLSNFRYVKGTAVYTSNFTPSTTPLTAITNTKLLSCQANRFLDASASAHTLTVGGSPSVQPFSPFNPTTAYSTSSIGGSGYFDGSGDNLTATNNAAYDFGSGNFTIEGWARPTTASQLAFAARGQSTGFEGWILSTTNFLATTNGSTWDITITFTSALVANAWNHVAVVRNGNVYTAYLNGVANGTTTVSGSIVAGTAAAVIGSRAGQTDYSGYIGDFRIVKGTAVYTAAFTPPTAPLTAISGTSLLLSGTNGAIFDNAAVADYETVGNAQISTSVKKYGTGSMAFDGTGDYLLPASNQNFAFRTGDFTVEYWIYTNSSADDGIFQLSTTAGGFATSYTNGMMMAVVSGVLYYALGGSSVSTGLTINNSTWYHVAMCRTSGVLKVYVNGTPVISTANTTDVTATNLVIGGYYSSSYTLVGYIDDFRISNLSRYPYNFTPPTAEFPNIGGTVTLTADPYFDYTTLLLPGNGTNGAQNNTFLDSSTNNFTITRNGNTTQGTFSPFSQTGWGNYFDGTGDYLTTNATQAIPATGDFTVDGWIWCNSYANGPSIISQGTAGTSGRTVIYITTAGKLALQITSTVNEFGSAIPTNQWVYFAITRTGSTVTAYINNSSIGTATNSGSIQNTTLTIGGEWNGDPYRWIGYLSNIRVSNVVRTITAAPTAPFTSDANTVVLTCQANRFIDASSNAYTITRNGDVSVQAFSPFNPTAAWSASTNGGSGYFDGSGDYLSIADNSAFTLGSGNWTLEMWIYPLTAASRQLIYAQSDNSGTTASTSLFWEITSGGVWRIQACSGGTAYSISSSAGAVANAWTHAAAVRNGNTMTLYINGVSVGTADLTGVTVNDSSNAVSIGTYGAGAGLFFNGYLCDVRLVKGTAVYTAAFTPPTAPLTAITNTSLLTNYTNAGIYDATAKNDLETVGNAQISTTQSKFGGSSMYFDGTGDYLVSNAATNNLYAFGTGDFTLEMWVYFNSVASGSLFEFRPASTNGAYPLIYFSSSGVLTYYANSNPQINSSSVSTGQWYHIALCRYGTSTKMFLNGIQTGSTYTDSSNYLCRANGPLIGVTSSLSSDFLNGYVNDFRITKGIARYTSNFTPPTTAFLTL
jgi:hypothetical protein